jgi:hypothetical protein
MQENEIDEQQGYDKNLLVTHIKMQRKPSSLWKRILCCGIPLMHKAHRFSNLWKRVYRNDVAK